MYCKDLLITDGLPPIRDRLFVDFHEQCSRGAIDTGPNAMQRFLDQAPKYLQQSQFNNLVNLDCLKYCDVIMGCNHYIDDLLIKHGVDGLQILEHDYRYYQRLQPELIYAKPGSLTPNKPMLIAAPFPGYLGLHPKWLDIIQECQDKQIPLHIDGSWLGSARDINIDFHVDCIKSFAMSLSKGQGLQWNRIGIRWRRDPGVDSVTIMNQHAMIPDMLARVALKAMQLIDRDYLWVTYGAQYYAICRELKLRPTAIIHAAQSLDRRSLVGLRNFFQ